ncbi:hypothetical protein GCM10022234_23380 [Aeromicrobium panaciterrae]|uniref:class I SAM-dependent methyltransferase n=1 Tax=Aeromicrobium panaciterrae TaxID=363861 RepID=UPI0031DDCF52
MSLTMWDDKQDALMDFGGLTVIYDDRVLTPRPWTLAQSIWSAELLRQLPDGPVLELCSGVGHIGLCAVADGRRELVMVDLNPAACEMARRNADAALMGHRVEIRQGSMEAVVADDETYALIIADPPWVASPYVTSYPEDPVIAIDGGNDGLDLARACCRVVDTHLAEGGAAILQLGTTAQADVIAAHLEESSTLRVREVRTYERGVLARLSRESSAGQQLVRPVAPRL